MTGIRILPHLSGDQDTSRGRGLGRHLTMKNAGFVLAGVIGGVLVYPLLPSQLTFSQIQYQSGYQAAKNLIENSTFGSALRTPDDVRVLVGTVTKMNDGNSLTMYVQSANPFDDPSLNERTILISSSTVLTSAMQKNPVVYQSEMAAYLRVASDKTHATTVATLPSAFVIKPITVSDIHVGDTIRISALDNIKYTQTFLVHTIQVIVAPPSS